MSSVIRGPSCRLFFSGHFVVCSLSAILSSVLRRPSCCLFFSGHLVLHFLLAILSSALCRPSCCLFIGGHLVVCSLLVLLSFVLWWPSCRLFFSGHLVVHFLLAILSSVLRRTLIVCSSAAIFSYASRWPSWVAIFSYASRWPSWVAILSSVPRRPSCPCYSGFRPATNMLLFKMLHLNFTSYLSTRQPGTSQSPIKRWPSATIPTAQLSFSHAFPVLPDTRKNAPPVQLTITTMFLPPQNPATQHETRSTHLDSSLGACQQISDRCQRIWQPCPCVVSTHA